MWNVGFGVHDNNSLPCDTGDILYSVFCEDLLNSAHSTVMLMVVVMFVCVVAVVVLVVGLVAVVGMVVGLVAVVGVWSWFWLRLWVWLFYIMNITILLYLDFFKKHGCRYVYHENLIICKHFLLI